MKEQKVQVILGAGGAIGVDLAKELKNYTNKIRLVGRNPQKVNDDDELFACDMTDANAVSEAVKDTEIAYLTIGLPYKTKVWKNHWSVVMQNTLEACKKHNTKLVFFDNIYMYNPNSLYPMNEETEMMPSSQKGKVRALVAQMLMEEVNAGNLEALIARSADFYGPGINNSVLNETVYANLKAGKKANWLCSAKFAHNFTYTPDAAKATALLGNTQSAYGQVWHLPTAKPWTGEQWINAFANELGIEPKTQVAPKFMVRIIGLFNPIMKELVEMLYQYDRDYNFDSSKFETAFDFKPTSNEDGVKAVVQYV
ncbi:NAD-dependent epimerase/dehydratase family protein [Prolixibacteraceae bacterium Z1-6]|uniref:NAD-dependent epimerase/dehydratase family protein n=1 Tax=Draconibacterium aestuarii TaxID=2998507 RepID=A0A9X3J8X4_9BACT|nr:NAD-dependent epimerase/dehydratase family protein [Prolixibacteraceae bacterium Z1-6]